VIAYPPEVRMNGVLGIWDGHESSVALVADGSLVFALSEERPTRIKRFSGFPYQALDLCIKWAQSNDIEIKDVAIAGRYGRAPIRAFDRFYARGDPNRDPLSPVSRMVRGWENGLSRVRVARAVERAIGLSFVRRRIPDQLGMEVGLHVVDHHDAHAWSALFGWNGDPALIATMDAYGEGRAATVRKASEPAEVVAEAGPCIGIASLYGAVTVGMGFEEGEEGRVLGLAARGRKDVSMGRFMDLFEERDGTPVLKRPLTRPRVDALLGGLTMEDAAASLQACTERLASRWLSRQMSKHPDHGHLLLAGGLFANVHVNRVLANLPSVDGVFVFPNMGDGGLSAGAANYLWHGLTGSLSDRLGHVFLGCGFSRGRMVGAARAQGLGCSRVGTPHLKAAEHISKGRIVCRFSGREEFGPRALGNRSILFSATHQDLAERVNQALERDGLMPFGPAIRDVSAGFALGGAKEGIDMRHMTVAMSATAEFETECPSAVHVDGSVRPQVVDVKTYPDLHALLTEHRGLGGKRAIINTSFNMHGEPIVHSPEDAVSTFKRSGLDILFMGDIEVRKAG